MKLTLGQAAKEVGISKPSLSAAIKNGRLSAPKNESGAYEIDPAELFRVYPPTSKTNSEPNSSSLLKTNPNTSAEKNEADKVLALLLEEKDKAIKRLEEEKENIRQDLEDQKEQSKRITLLLENKNQGREESWEKSIRALEQRIANQEKAAKEREEKEQRLMDENRRIKQAYSKQKKVLEEEKSKSLWQRIFG